MATEKRTRRKRGDDSDSGGPTDGKDATDATGDQSDACIACGYDPNATVTGIWVIEVRKPAISQNQLGGNGRGKSGWKYRKYRREFGAALRSYSALIPKAKGFRRVWFKRYYGKRKRPFDRGNLAGGMKPLLDELVSAGWLVDDSPKFCQDHYAQEKSPSGSDYILVTLEDIDE